MIHIIWSIIVGFLVGLVARALLPGAQHLGFLMTTVLGIVGSLVGGVIGRIIHKPAADAKFHPAGFIMSVVCSMALLYCWIRFM